VLKDIQYKIKLWLLRLIIGNDAVAMNVGVYCGRWYPLNRERNIFVEYTCFVGIPLESSTSSSS